MSPSYRGTHCSGCLDAELGSRQIEQTLLYCIQHWFSDSALIPGKSWRSAPGCRCDRFVHWARLDALNALNPEPPPWHGDGGEITPPEELVPPPGGPPNKNVRANSSDQVVRRDDHAFVILDTFRPLLSFPRLPWNCIQVGPLVAWWVPGNRA